MWICISYIQATIYCFLEGIFAYVWVPWAFFGPEVYLLPERFPRIWTSGWTSEGFLKCQDIFHKIPAKFEPNTHSKQCFHTILPSTHEKNHTPFLMGHVLSFPFHGLCQSFQNHPCLGDRKWISPLLGYLVGYVYRTFDVFCEQYRSDRCWMMLI